MGLCRWLSRQRREGVWGEDCARCASSWFGFLAQTGQCNTKESILQQSFPHMSFRYLLAIYFLKFTSLKIFAECVPTDHYKFLLSDTWITVAADSEFPGVPVWFVQGLMQQSRIKLVPHRMQASEKPSHGFVGCRLPLQSASNKFIGIRDGSPYLLWSSNTNRFGTPN